MTSDSLLGQQLDEYRVEALLGQGGMARVYRGLDTRLRRYVAIKVIDAPFRSDSDYVMRFEREARAIAQLEHPHIVRLYRYGESNGQLYMAMQYIEGASLETVLASYRADGEFIEPNDVARIVREVCLALDYAHGKGVIHRDVKPANIMLDKQGRAILTDFGLALLTEIGTRGEIFGSPHYLAPEQAISSAKAVPQSDLYSVGVILYEAFTGQVPFEAEQPLDVAMLHVTEPPRPPRELRPELSPQVEAVILKALAKEPRERYPNGAALAEAFEQATRANSGFAQAPVPKTLSHLSVPERVALDLTDHQLPPIPAAAPAQGAKPETAPQLALPASIPAAPSATRPRRLILYGTACIGILALILIILLAAGGALWLAANPGGIAIGPATTKGTPLPGTENGQASAYPPAGVGTPFPTTGSGTAATSVVAGPIATPVLSGGTFPVVMLPVILNNFFGATPVPVIETEATATVLVALTATTPTPPASYELRLVKRGKDGLFVVNVGDLVFPLELLRLVGRDEEEIEGKDWERDVLQPGECVVIWKEEGRPRLPESLDCTLVGETLRVNEPDEFWSPVLEVYLDGELAGTCPEDEKECSIPNP